MFRRFATLLLAASLSTTALVGCDAEEDAVAGDEQNATSSKPGKFETFQGIDGQHYFHLLSANGQKVLQSEGYTTLKSAEKGVESVRTNGVEAASYLVQEATNGEFYFVLLAANDEIIGTSQLYSTKSNAKKGHEAVRKLVAKAQRQRAAEDGGAEFAVITGSDSKKYFHLRAGNGEIVLQSQGYSSKSKALDGIDAVRDNGKEEASYEIVELDDGGAFFRLKAGNGEIIGRSEIYVSTSNAERGADTVRELLASELVADAD